MPTMPAGSTDLPMGLSMERPVSNDWGMGYCYTYQVKNVSMAPITWAVVLDVRGRMNQHWECNISGETGRVTFTGVDHNQTLAPNGMAQFGFCAQVN